MKIGRYIKHVILALANKRELDAPLFVDFTKSEKDIETLDFMKDLIEKRVQEVSGEGPRTIIKGFRKWV